MVATTREQHDAIFYHCMRLIENPEYHDGSGTLCTMLIINDINTIIDIISLDDKESKLVYTSSTKTKPKHYLTMYQINAVNCLKHYNMNQCRSHGSFPPKTWLKVTREEFELFRISCNPFDYKAPQTNPPPYKHIATTCSH